MEIISFLRAVRILLFICATVPALSVAQDNLRPVTRFLPDPVGNITIAEIVESDDFLAFGSVPLPDEPAAVWTRMDFSNTTDRDLSRVLQFSGLLRHGEVYVTDGKQIVNKSTTGNDLAPRNKYFFSTNNYAELFIPPGQTRTVYLRTDCKKRWGNDCYEKLYKSYPLATLQARLIRKTAWSYTYLGLMIMFGAISIFSFFLFRRVVFLSFGMLMLSFGLYFLLVYGTEATLVPGGLSPADRYAVISLIMAIVLSLSHFVASYLRLGETFPRYSVAYLIIVVSAVLIQVPIVILDLGRASIYASNVAIIIWVVATIYPIARLALRGNKAARVLGVSIALLFLGSFFYLFVLLIASLQVPILVENAFQISTLLFAAIVFRELFVGFTKIKQEKEQITQTEELKSHFFANVTHEFRTPLALMLGPLRQVISRSEEPEDIALLRVAEMNAERQLELVNQLLDLSQLDANALQLAAAPQDFTAYLRRVVGTYASEADFRGIELEFIAPAHPPKLYFDNEKMDNIFYNLLTNAFKYTPAGGKIVVAGTRGAKEITVSIADTGQGIEADLLPRIFERFSFSGTGNTDTKGSGIGLAIVREMVQLHQGTIAVTSTPEVGTTFTLSFPLGKDHLKPEQIVTLPSPTAVLPKIKFTPVPVPEELTMQEADSELPTVLLIEDNAEMRGFISQTLARKFRIRTAPDGEQGVNQAVKDPPDLIISDLMMPKKDGYEVCRDLKSDLRTSHVPIILLTARSSQDARLAGLGDGADDYLTKPFDVRELTVRAENLIHSRRHLRERFAGSITVLPSELTVSSLDQEFLTAALAHVENHLAHPDLSIDQLAGALNVSQSQLNRKLRALVDKSSNQFIQSVRLQRAAQLLREGGVTAKEVCYTCGFSSPGYFTKLFKAEFGLTPGQFARSLVG